MYRSELSTGAAVGSGSFVNESFGKAALVVFEWAISFAGNVFTDVRIKYTDCGNSIPSFTGRN
jgi:hypothetical protein